MRQQGEAAAAEDAGEPVLPVEVDDDAVDGLAERAGLADAMRLSSMPWVPS